MRRILERGRRQGLAVRDRPQVRRLGHHRAGAARRLAGRGAGERSVLLRRRLDRATPRRRSTRFVDLAETFHLPVVHLVDMPGFVIGIEAEKAGTIRLRRARADGDLSGDGAVVLDHHPQGLRRRRRGHTHASRGCTIATPGRRATGARCRSRAASRRPTAPSSTPRPIAKSCAPRSRSGSTATLAVPHRRDASDRGDHRPARHAAAAVRIRESDRETARAWARSRSRCGREEIPACRRTVAERLISPSYFDPGNSPEWTPFRASNNGYMLSSPCPVGAPLLEGRHMLHRVLACKFATTSSKRSETPR